MWSRINLNQTLPNDRQIAIKKQSLRDDFNNQTTALPPGLQGPCTAVRRGDARSGVVAGNGWETKLFDR